MPQWVYDFNFIGLSLAWIISGFIVYEISEYIGRCIKRSKSRKAARARLAEIKRREEYERATARFRDPHYYGD